MHGLVTLDLKVYHWNSVQDLYIRLTRILYRVGGKCLVMKCSIPRSYCNFSYQLCHCKNLTRTFCVSTKCQLERGKRKGREDWATLKCLLSFCWGLLSTFELRPDTNSSPTECWRRGRLHQISAYKTELPSKTLLKKESFSLCRSRPNWHFHPTLQMILKHWQIKCDKSNA